MAILIILVSPLLARQPLGGNRSYRWPRPMLPAGAGPWAGWGGDGAGLPQVAAEYFKNTTLLLVGVICVAAAVEKWDLHKRIALRMVIMAGAKPGM